MRKSIGALALLLIFAPSLWAAQYGLDMAIPSEEDLMGDLPVVLSASRLIQPLDEAPVATTVIDRKMIEASGAQNIPELLRMVPGFQVRYENGHDISVTYHGMAGAYSRRLQVLIDGRSVYIPTTGGVPWNDLPVAMEDIERIEVVRGPNAASYGANAFLGVINIITQHAAEQHGETVAYTTSDDGYHRLFARHNGTTGDLDYRVSLAYQNDDGFSSRNDSSKTFLGSLRADYRASAADMLLGEVGWNFGPREVGKGDPSDPQRNQQVTSLFQHLRWTHLFGPEQELRLQFSHHTHTTDDQYEVGPISLNPGPPYFGHANADIFDERYDFEAQHTISPLESMRLVWGLNLRLDRARAPGLLGTPKTLDNHLYRAFANVELRPIERLLFNFGGLYEHNDITSDTFSPRAAVNLHVTPQQTLRYSWSRATRTPVLYEDRANTSLTLAPESGPYPTFTQVFFHASGGLKPERITAQEIGYIGDFKDLGLLLNLKLYHDTLRDIISPFYAGSYTDFANLDRAVIEGFEGSATLRPGRHTRLIGTFAHTAIHSPPSASSNDYSDTAAHNSYGLHLIHTFPHGVLLGTHYYFEDKLFNLSSDQVTGPNRRLDLKLEYKDEGEHSRANVALVVQNALDAPVEEVRTTQLYDRRIYLQVGLSLN